MVRGVFPSASPRVIRSRATYTGSSDEAEDNEDDVTLDKEYWAQETEYTPESRVELHRHQLKARQKQVSSRPFNINDPACVVF